MSDTRLDTVMPVTQDPILFIEDDKALRELGARILRDAGYVVREAASAQEALGMLNDPTVRFALVATDIVLPGASGSSLITRLRTLRPGTPALAISGYSDRSGHSLSIAELGVDDDIAFLAKPYGTNQLLRAVADALAHRRQSDQKRGFGDPF